MEGVFPIGNGWTMPLNIRVEAMDVVNGTKVVVVVVVVVELVVEKMIVEGDGKDAVDVSVVVEVVGSVDDKMKVSDVAVKKDKRLDASVVDVVVNGVVILGSLGGS